MDDIVLLSAFFADPDLEPRTIIVGQFLGIGVLFLVSVVAALGALVVPRGYTALLGAVPLLLGIRALWSLFHGNAGNHAATPRMEQRARSQVLTVAVVTVANG